jgi:hypothetical protein
MQIIQIVNQAASWQTVTGWRVDYRKDNARAPFPFYPYQTLYAAVNEVTMNDEPGFEGSSFRRFFRGIGTRWFWQEFETCAICLDQNTYGYVIGCHSWDHSWNSGTMFRHGDTNGRFVPVDGPSDTFMQVVRPQLPQIYH